MTKGRRLVCLREGPPDLPSDHVCEVIGACCKRVYKRIDVAYALLNWRTTPVCPSAPCCRKRSADLTVGGETLPRNMLTRLQG